MSILFAGTRNKRNNGIAFHDIAAVNVIKQFFY